MAYDPARFKKYFEHELTYASGFARNVSRFASRVAITDPVAGRELTYAQLGQEVDARYRQPRLGVGGGARGLGPAEPDVLHHQHGSRFFHLRTPLLGIQHYRAGASRKNRPAGAFGSSVRAGAHESAPSRLAPHQLH